MGGLGQVLVGLLLAFAWAAPMILARSLADTLDRAPYLISLAIGLGAAILLGVARWPELRGARATRVGASATLLAILFLPTWAIAVGLGANRLFDRSTSVAHACRVLEWQHPAKGSARCLVSSWRDRPTEAVSAALLGDAATDDGRFPRACTPGRSIVVSTRAGALGWEWIADVRLM